MGGESPFVCVWRLSLCQQVALCPGLVPTGQGCGEGGRSLAFPGLPPDHRQGAPADARLPCSFICQEAGGEVLVPLQVIPAVHQARPCFSPAPPCALHPGQFTAEATEPPGKAVPPGKHLCGLTRPLLEEPSGEDHPRGGRRRLCSASVGGQPSGKRAVHARLLVSTVFTNLDV